MRLASAQSELKEKEGLCKDSGHSYTQDKAKFDALGKDIAKIEVRMCIVQYQILLYNYTIEKMLQLLLHAIHVYLSGLHAEKNWRAG